MKTLAILATTTTALVLATVAWAGSPHFVGTPTFTVDGRTITVTGKEAGLGNETQVHIELTATAECINHGGNHPQATNKTSVTAAGDFPVQNGKADFTLTATAVFDPDPASCDNVAFTNITVTDTTHGVTATL